MDDELGSETNIELLRVPPPLIAPNFTTTIWNDNVWDFQADFNVEMTAKRLRICTFFRRLRELLDEIKSDYYQNVMSLRIQ